VPASANSGTYSFQPHSSPSGSLNRADGGLKSGNSGSESRAGGCGWLHFPGGLGIGGSARLDESGERTDFPVVEKKSLTDFLKRSNSRDSPPEEKWSFGRDGFSLDTDRGST
jgi:hypothetical protein